MKISFLLIKGSNAAKQLYKCQAQYISSIMLITGVPQGNGHGKAVHLPKQLLLRFAATLPAFVNDDM